MIICIILLKSPMVLLIDESTFKPILNSFSTSCGACSEPVEEVVASGCCSISFSPVNSWVTFDVTFFAAFVTVSTGLISGMYSGGI